MLLAHQSSKDLMARLKTAAVAAGASGRESIFAEPPDAALVGDVIVFAVRYGLEVRSLFSTAARA